MNKERENGPCGLFHDTTRVGLIIHRERLKNAGKSDLDIFWEEAVARLNGPKNAPAMKSRTREQIAEAQAKLEEGRIYYKLHADGALVPISK
jgi:hypothetical protein